MKKASRLMCLLLIVVGLSGCGKQADPIKKIQESGALRVGVKVDVPSFGYLSPLTNELEGLEIDLARLIAQEILGDSDAVKMVGVTAQTREPMLENGELDLVIATFTITEERKKKFLFTAPYYNEEIGFLVRQDSTSMNMQDMDGKTVGTVQAGTARSALEAEAEKLGLAITCVEYASYPEVMWALLSGAIEAFSSDKSILLGYLDQDTRLLDTGFRMQDYGIAVRRNQPELSQYLNGLLDAMTQDGRLDELLDRWNLKANE